MPSEELLEKVSHLPTTPGVYLWRDQYNRIIYVGKAINLRNRVRSYVRNDANRAPKVAAMMKRAVDVEIIQTKTEMEALILRIRSSRSMNLNTILGFVMIKRIRT